MEGEGIARIPSSVVVVESMIFTRWMRFPRSKWAAKVSGKLTSHRVNEGSQGATQSISGSWFQSAVRPVQKRVLVFRFLPWKSMFGCPKQRSVRLPPLPWFPKSNLKVSFHVLCPPTDSNTALLHLLVAVEAVYFPSVSVPSGGQSAVQCDTLDCPHESHVDSSEI